MGHAGRPRKNGKRETSGRIQRIKNAEKRAGETEKTFVMRQPHRCMFNGQASDQRAESELGRFCLRRGLRRELYDGGIAFGALYRKVLSSRARSAGISSHDFEPHVRGTSDTPGLSTSRARSLQKQLDRVRNPLKKSHPAGYASVVTLAVYEQPIDVSEEFACSKALYLVAVAMGKVGRKRYVEDDSVRVIGGCAEHVERGKPGRLTNLLFGR